MSDAGRRGEPARCDWIEDADRDELARLFVWVDGNEPMLPPRERRGSPHPSLLMLYAPAGAHADGDLRLAARLARHVTASAATHGDWRGASYVSLRRDGEAWVADKSTWLDGGQRRADLAAAVSVLVPAAPDDRDDVTALEAALAEFDERFGHGPAGPRP